MSKTYESNRDRLRRILAELEEIYGDEAIGPTPFGNLTLAYDEIELALKFAVDQNERDALKAAV